MNQEGDGKEEAIQLLERPINSILDLQMTAGKRRRNLHFPSPVRTYFDLRDEERINLYLVDVMNLAVLRLRYIKKKKKAFNFSGLICYIKL